MKMTGTGSNFVRGTDEWRDVREEECGQAQWAGLLGMESEKNIDCNGELSLWVVTLL